MCGIFGIISDQEIDKLELSQLAYHSEQRGRDSSGLATFNAGTYHLYKSDQPITRLLRDKRAAIDHSHVAMGHSRLVTNGMSDNQPVVYANCFALHNGIILNHDDLWPRLNLKRQLEIDSEIIPALATNMLSNGNSAEECAGAVLDRCKGVVACALAFPRLGKLCLFSNNGSLYLGRRNRSHIFASESYPLAKMNCSLIQQVKAVVTIDIPVSEDAFVVQEFKTQSSDLLPKLQTNAQQERLLRYELPAIRRCTKCILPETMPYISFNSDGVCSYCQHYRPRNVPRPKEELFNLVEPYRRTKANECIVPFSGGRDSCYGLHLVVNELKMKAIAYTYDWGMVTDLGRRNISRMCSELGVENIIVAADIRRKRDNIRKNVRAWLKYPHLGMVSIFTAGDKHFFKYVEHIKSQTGVNLNLWGVNPLEVTHFKAGFLGVPPDFEEKRVYSHGAMKQLRYQTLRLKAMLPSPGYFNSSLWDTLSGEYYRSFTNKQDYFHIFDYWKWDEKVVDSTLADYQWEKAPDTNTTWRIGDGTSAFYNYIYYSVAGFTEHDTFRSNQVREGDLTRSEAIALVKDENRPRYSNIKWYLDAVNLDFEDTIRVINDIPKLYKL